MMTDVFKREILGGRCRPRQEALEGAFPPFLQYFCRLGVSAYHVIK
jgi:hypothetical protein